MNGQQQPIELYYWRTPNSTKITIFCEEAELPYRLRPVNIGEGDQHGEEFRSINPNGKVPAMTDPAGPDGTPITLFESGAMLIYLAEKTGKFLPTEPVARYTVLQWLMFQMGSLGPLLGQAHHFLIYCPEKIPYAVERYSNEAARLYAVLDRRLEGRDYIADDYSIADMATLPWIVPHKRQNQDLTRFPNLRRWFDTLRDRPAVSRGLDVGKELYRRDAANIDDTTREMLFGKTQFKR